MTKLNDAVLILSMANPETKAVAPYWADFPNMVRFNNFPAMRNYLFVNGCPKYMYLEDTFDQTTPWCMGKNLLINWMIEQDIELKGKWFHPEFQWATNHLPVDLSKPSNYHFGLSSTSARFVEYFGARNLRNNLHTDREHYGLPNLPSTDNAGSNDNLGNSSP